MKKEVFGDFRGLKRGKQDVSVKLKIRYYSKAKEIINLNNFHDSFSK
ncbi:hypothetical protein I7V34_18190 [Bacillus sp. V3]|nr:hypothetical protein I7V34_18190 [Bacillus sp. V3]